MQVTNRLKLVFSMIGSGLAAFLIWFVRSSSGNLALSCIFGAVSTMGFNALDCLGAELFPTNVRLDKYIFNHNAITYFLLSNPVVLQCLLH